MDDSRAAGRKPITRRAVLAKAAIVAGAGTIAPFSFIRSVAAGPAGLHAFLRQQRLAAHSPGMSVAVVKGNSIVFAAGSGWANIERGIHATEDTVFMLASVSKTVTCAGIMSLVEDGVIDLDANINKYVPFEVRIPAYPNVPITMRMLLTHSSSIRDRYNIWGTPYSKDSWYFHGDSPISLGQFARYYYVPGGSEYRHNHNFFARKPGSDYTYSNLAVALAGYVAESAAGKDFNRLCKERILHPLEMRQSGFRRADITTANLAMPYHINRDTRAFVPYFQYGYPDYPDGALRTSAAHLARWLGAFINFGSFQGARVLRRATVHEIRHSQIPNIVPWRQGLIWYQIKGRYPRMGHTGGDFGMSTRMFFRLDRDIGVVTLANAYLSGKKWDAMRAVELRMFDEFS
jgi:CubicO group peptidase (beta-lactamase class C family)